MRKEDYGGRFQPNMSGSRLETQGNKFSSNFKEQAMLTRCIMP